MRQQPSSAPTFETGAPDAFPTPARGRCAICTRPILSGEAAHHVPTSVDTGSPVPYQHKECPQ